MKARIVGLIVFGLVGFLLGAGTGIVGGVFVGVPGVFVFTILGAIYGLSGGPDIARCLRRFSTVWMRK